MGLVDVINDMDFKLLVADLRKGFRQFIKSTAKHNDIKYVKLHAAIYQGRTDTVGIMAAVSAMNKPTAKYEKTYPDIVALEFPTISTLANRHDEDIIVVANMAIAFATTKAPKLHEILTTTEAAEEWGVDGSTIRKAIDSGRFEEHEYRRSGPRSWLILHSAMERVYGQPRLQ